MYDFSIVHEGAFEGGRVVDGVDSTLFFSLNCEPCLLASFDLRLSNFSKNLFNSAVEKNTSY